MPKKKVTIDHLAVKIDKLSDNVNKISNNLDVLAIITKKGFDKVDKDIKELKDGHEDIKLRLTNVAYRFELVELSKRVEFLEHKLGVKH